MERSADQNERQRRGSLSNAWARVHRFAFGPLDPIPLQVFRSLFALALLLYVLDRATHPLEWLTQFGFHYSSAARLGHEPLPAPPLPVWLVAPFLAFFLGSLVAMVVGWRARLMTWIALGCLVYATLADLVSAFTLNKIFIVGLLVLGLAPQPVRVREDGEEVWRISAWPIRVLQATLLIQYATAGWCKVLHGDWLNLGFYHGQWSHDGDVLWSHVQGFYCTDLAAWMLRTVPSWSWTVMQDAALAFELLAPLLFVIRRTRVLAMLWGFGFQLVIALTMYKLFYFSFQMVTLYVLFFDAAFLHRIVGGLGSKLPVGAGWRRSLPGA